MRSKTLLAVICTALTCTAQHKQIEHPVRYPSRGMRGSIACGSEYAAEAGMRLYYAGGNAVDAAIAGMFAAMTTEFSHIGWGGEAPILIRTKEGKVYAIAGVGTMPKLATAQFFRERRLRPMEVLEIDPGGLKGMVPVAGLMPALVPSSVDAGLLALREFGTKSFAQVVEPAIELADGMPIDEMRSASIAATRPFFDVWPTSKHVFMPEGHVPRPGEIFRQPDLARTLRSMAAAEQKALASGAPRNAAIDAVRDYFYRGEVARKIDAFMKANDGLLRYEDMAAFRLQVEQPVSTNYHGYEVYKPGFWSQGPAMIEALNILEGFNLQAMGYNSAEYIHTLVEALKLAYADRDTYFGDPKFNTGSPFAQFVSKQYAAERRKLIAERASLDFRPGAVNGKVWQHPTEADAKHIKIDDALMAHDTTCVDTIDRDGIEVSITPSGAWLPSVVAGDTGIALTARAQSFLLIPGHPNELAGGKRPRVTLSPTLVTRDGKPAMVLSTPGGDDQEQTLVQLFLNVVEFGMNAQMAVEAPRFQTRHLVSSFDNHAWNRGDLILDERIPQNVYEALTTRGHHTSRASKWDSGAAPVLVRVLRDGVIEAGADPYYYRVARSW
ncbi:MAG TPA: gamma-glutamyltransferase family protein [Bryobacteraceae bacterium]|nr:gamma-glutamyltransferase family protein [Bryobacteraceae bacterium]